MEKLIVLKNVKEMRSFHVPNFNSASFPLLKFSQINFFPWLKPLTQALNYMRSAGKQDAGFDEKETKRISPKNPRAVHLTKEKKNWFNPLTSKSAKNKNSKNISQISFCKILKN